MSGLRINGTGSAIPALNISNDRFADVVDTSDEWISSRSGIRSRNFAVDEDHRSLAGAAAKKAIAAAGIKPEDIGVIVCAVITGDYLTPSLACILQKDLAVPEQVFAIDINGACSGFVYALNVAHSLLHKYPGKYALVVGSELLSRIVNFEDRSTCVLFGDGSGAAIVSLDEQGEFEFLAGAKGDENTLVCPAAYASVNPFTPQKKQPSQLVHMDGQEVYRFAVESFSKSVNAVLERVGLQPDDIDHYLCHQANLRIIKNGAKKLRVSMDKFFVNIEHRGNTSAASIAIALDEFNASGKLKRGDKLVMAGFGGGLTYGAIYLIW